MNRNKIHFEDESRLTPAVSEAVSARDAAEIGESLSRAVKGGKILVSSSGENGGAALAKCVAAGAASAGSDCIIAEDCSASAAVYAAKALGCKAGCRCHTEITASFKLTASDGLNLFERTENEIIAGLDRKNDVPYSHYGRITVFEGASELYSSYMKKYIGGRLNVFADINSSSDAIVRECKQIIGENNNKTAPRTAFRISGDGSRISAYSDQTGYVFREKLISLCCRDLFERGIDAAVCGSVPRVLERLASDYGRKIISCGKNICRTEAQPSEKCRLARSLASEQLFMYDGIALMITTLEILRKTEMPLAEAIKSLPPQAGVSRFIPVNSPSELLRKLSCPDGVLSDGTSGRVTIRPVRTGKGIMLNVESFALEAASELCDFYEGLINRHRN